MAADSASAMVELIHSPSISPNARSFSFRNSAVCVTTHLTRPDASHNPAICSSGDKVGSAMVGRLEDLTIVEGDSRSGLEEELSDGENLIDWE